LARGGVEKREAIFQAKPAGVDYAELGIIHIMPSPNLCRERGSHPRVAPSGLVWSTAGLGINLQIFEERQ
jgi:hypothetical protein